MDMIGLDGKFHNLPVVFGCHLLNDLLQTVIDWPHQHLSSALWAKDDVLENMMDGMLFVNILVCFHDS